METYYTVEQWEKVLVPFRGFTVFRLTALRSESAIRAIVVLVPFRGFTVFRPPVYVYANVDGEIVS